MSMERVSRTLCRIACLYCFSLFATSMGLAAAYTAGQRDARLCLPGYCTLVATTTKAPRRASLPTQSLATNKTSG